jgi:hypothetical protein
MKKVEVLNDSAESLYNAAVVESNAVVNALRSEERFSIAALIARAEKSNNFTLAAKLRSKENKAKSEYDKALERITKLEKKAAEESKKAEEKENKLSAYSTTKKLCCEFVTFSLDEIVEKIRAIDVDKQINVDEKMQTIRACFYETRLTIEMYKKYNVGNTF